MFWTSQRNVALLADRMRPMTVSSLSRIAARSVSALPLGIWVICCPGHRTAAIAVGADTDVPGRVQRFLA
ncbi:Uncharacterised protein [Mycobacteroides abscessus subsp. abscessus]|nr:Uncharacterised protein [Mycobacteroides abscessus subsp. abscessus]